MNDGNERQKAAYQVLTQHRFFEKVIDFDPILTSTIPIKIDLPSSDLDIICFYYNKVDFIDRVVENLREEKDFLLRKTIIRIMRQLLLIFGLMKLNYLDRKFQQLSRMRLGT